MTPQQGLDEGIRRIDEHFSSCIGEIVTEHPPELFHYTSIEGLLGILTKGSFYASDILSMRDQSEFRHGVVLAKTVIAELFTATNHSIAGSMLKVFETHPMLGVGKTTFFHAVCFCSKIDVLTQWQAFSSTGGFALGLDFNKVEQSQPSMKFILAKMLYGLKEQDDLVRRVIKNGIHVFDDLGGSMIGSPSHLDQFVLRLGVTLYNSICRFKHPCFHSEEEWRILTSEFDNSNAVKPNFRASGRSLVPYRELSIDPSWITRLIRSPGAWPENHRYSVERLARSLGGNVMVQVSDLPFI